MDIITFIETAKKDRAVLGTEAHKISLGFSIYPCQHAPFRFYFGIEEARFSDSFLLRLVRTRLQSMI
jgi:hypothetical protein